MPKSSYTMLLRVRNNCMHVFNHSKVQQSMLNFPPQLSYTLLLCSAGQKLTKTSTAMHCSILTTKDTAFAREFEERTMPVVDIQGVKSLLCWY